VNGTRVRSIGMQRKQRRDSSGLETAARLKQRRAATDSSEGNYSSRRYALGDTPNLERNALLR
jgi:hypothetical protein